MMVEEFLENLPNYEEVRALVKAFKEIVPLPYELRNGTLIGKVGNLEVRLKKMQSLVGDQLFEGVRLSIGNYWLSEFEEKAAIYGGPTLKNGKVEPGIYFAWRIDPFYLNRESDKQTLELMNKFYERLKESI